MASGNCLQNSNSSNNAHNNSNTTLQQYTVNNNLIGFNTQGFKSNVPYISEHWLSNAEKPIIKDLCSQHTLFFSPAEKNLSGRAYSGNCFLVNETKAGNTEVIHEDPHILAIKTSLNQKVYIIVGVYLTCYHDKSSLEKYESQLNTITSLLKLYSDEGEVIILGDVQSFPENIYDNHVRNNPKRNPLSKPLYHFLQTNNLELIDVTMGSGPLQTYQHKTLPNSSYIDHIIMHTENNVTLSKCKIHCISESNNSDHQPVSITITDNLSLDYIVKEETRNHILPKFVWKEDSFIKEFQYVLSNKLNNVDLNDPDDVVNLNLICKHLTESASSAYQTCFPQQNLHNRYTKPWWTPELTRLKEVLSTHFKAWKNQGFPKDINNIYHNRYLLARKNFRKAVKYSQNKKVYDSLYKTANLKNTHPQKYWNKLRLMKKSSIKKKFTINNMQSNQDITDEFAKNFNLLLNTPLIERKDQGIRVQTETSTEINTTTIDIKNVIKLLKTNKTSDPFDIVGEHIIYADNDKLYEWMRKFYDDIFKNHDTPKDLSMSIIHPLVKSYKKSLNSFSNYRGISIVPVFTKILEYLILQKCPEIMDSHHLQHGYKESSSTLHAEFLIKETIQFYNNSGSPIYICGLDAEKAFDSCNWDILFEKLRDKGISHAIINVIKSLYTNSTAEVYYNGCTSKVFKLSQGVRQGSVLSPHLYNIYTEELLNEIETHATTGTTIYGHYTGITMYADDIILMSTTLSGLQELIDTCVRVSNKNCIKFNSAKTEFCISHKAHSSLNYVVIEGHTIYPKDNLKHLGFLWNNKRNILTIEDKNIEIRIGKFWAVVESLIKIGIRFCHPKTIKELYNSIAIPTLTYGIELCSLNDNLVNKLNIAGRKGLKALFNISVYSRNYLHTLLNIKHVSTIIMKNKLNLLTRLLHNEKTADILLQSLNETYQTFAIDSHNIATKLGLDFLSLIISKKCPIISNPLDNPTIDDATYNDLMLCINSWNIKESRIHFTSILEEHVIRTTS